jgi:hypothetical protein
VGVCIPWGRKRSGTRATLTNILRLKPGACPDAPRGTPVSREDLTQVRAERVSGRLFAPTSNRSRFRVRARSVAPRSAPLLPRPGTMCITLIKGDPPP